MALNLTEFRLELERQLRIHRWKPTDTQLQLIASAIKRRLAIHSPTDIDVLEIVRKYANIESFFIMDGVDHSDLKTLLLLATKAN